VQEPAQTDQRREYTNDVEARVQICEVVQENCVSPEEILRIKMASASCASFCVIENTGGERVPPRRWRN
jgi:hypothetical protein